MQIFGKFSVLKKPRQGDHLIQAEETLWCNGGNRSWWWSCGGIGVASGYDSFKGSAFSRERKE